MLLRLYFLLLSEGQSLNMSRYFKVMLTPIICLFGIFFILLQVQAQSISAPTIIAPQSGSVINKAKPIVAGLTLSGTFVQVYIDGTYNGKTDIVEHDSGIASFTYEPFLDLRKGNHVIWLIAENETGLKSRPTNPVRFTIKLPDISEGVQEKEDEKVAEIKPAEDQEEPAAIISPEEGTIEEGGTIDEEIQKLIAKGIEEEEGVTGFINEGRERLGKLNLNLVIFIIFLLGIIVWIFWVNRELIKERQAQAKREVKGDQDKSEPTSVQDKKSTGKDDMPPPQDQPPLV